MKPLLAILVFAFVATSSWAADARPLLKPNEQAQLDAAAVASNAVMETVAIRANAGEAALTESTALKAQVAQLQTDKATLQASLTTAQTALATSQAALTKSQADLATANKKLADIKAAGGF